MRLSSGLQIPLMLAVVTALGCGQRPRSRQTPAVPVEATVTIRVEGMV